MKEKTYQEKFQILQPFFQEIINEIRRELKNEHIRKDFAFNQKYFGKKGIDKITLNDLVDGYTRALNEGNEEAGEWIASRWMLKHPEMYQFFAERLSVINPNFDEIEILTDAQARDMMERSIEMFGSRETYIFSVLNSVVFSNGLYEELRLKATAIPQKVDVADTRQEVRYEDLIAKLTEKYEKKLQSLEKKYVQDVEGYKKQIAALQRQLK